MKLIGKKILLMVSDGVEQDEYEMLKKRFEGEMAEVFCTSPQDYLTIESVKELRRGKDITLDFPIDAVEAEHFDALVIPDGLLSTDLLKHSEVAVDLVKQFHSLRKPIFASGRAVELLLESNALPDPIMVREETPLPLFIDQAIEMLLTEPTPFRYRSMAVSF